MVVTAAVARARPAVRFLAPASNAVPDPCRTPAPNLAQSPTRYGSGYVQCAPLNQARVYWCARFSDGYSGKPEKQIRQFHEIPVTHHERMLEKLHI